MEVYSLQKLKLSLSLVKSKFEKTFINEIAIYSTYFIILHNRLLTKLFNCRRTEGWIPGIWHAQCKTLPNKPYRHRR